MNCHLIDGHGGRRGPDLTCLGDRLTHDDIVIRIVNGGVNMPAFGKSLKPEELANITAFVESRKQPVSAASLGATEKQVSGVDRTGAASGEVGCDRVHYIG